VQELVDVEFLSSTWGRPGHGVPARRAAAQSVIDAERAPENEQAIVTAMESGAVFVPNTSHALDAYGATADLFTRMNKGEIEIADALAQIETAANEALAPDRSP
jgi:hypothetical protein